MSFILDALKKSEAERQRQSLPGLVDAGIARPVARRPVWAIALVALLGVNLVVLVLLYLHHGGGDTPAVRSRTDAARAQPTPGENAGDQHFSPMDGTPPVYAPEIPADDPTPARRDAIPAAREAAREAARDAARDVRPRDAARDVRPRDTGRDPVLTEDYKPEDAEILPTMNEMNLSGTQALPELHLDVHVYATKPSERFVYINMRKYHEKGTLQEGPTIERIRRDGVVLDYHGVRFLLPRQ